MKERPILFKAEMVNAILSGNKTQTRRVIKDQPYIIEGNVAVICGNDTTIDILRDINKTSKYIMDNCKCPYGKVGDELWVRETHAVCSDGSISYAADRKLNFLRYKPSIHMFRKHSRIQLEITEIRVERLNDISERDAMAEGCEYEGWSPSYSDPDSGGDGNEILPSEKFYDLWESINGKDSWDLNPWVWVVEFKVISKGDS